MYRNAQELGVRMLGLVKSVRQNHALEHATIHVLSRGVRDARVMGRSTPSGFQIIGQVSTQDVSAAATEALARLQHGETHLAIHPRCGTNLAVTGVLAGTAAFGATLGKPRSRIDRLPWSLMAATVAALFAQPLAYSVQEHVTTTADLEGVYLKDIKRRDRGVITVHKVIVGRE
jgi:hypothetical protein